MRDQKPETRATDLFYGAVTIGERGQIVIPAEARKFHSLSPGDKLLVFRHPHMHGLMLARVDEVESLLGELREVLKVVAEAREQTLAPAPRPRRNKRGTSKG